MTTKDEIEVHLEDYGWSEWLFGPHRFFDITEDLMAAVQVSEGGHEGGGERVRLVIEVTQSRTDRRFEWKPASRYFEKLGYYSSYEGVEWDGSFSEVFPKQKTVTVYEKS